MSALTRETAYCIWSDDDRAWWRPRGCGYTKQLRYAGCYSELEARQLAQDDVLGQTHAVRLERALWDNLVEPTLPGTVGALLEPHAILRS